MSSVSPSPALTLADGGQFPSVGLGMWKMPKPALPGLVQEAIKLGYRHLDCACDYGNEPEVGAGITAFYMTRQVMLVFFTKPRWNESDEVTDDGLVFLVMELLDGEDLDRLLMRDGAMPIPRAIHLVLQALRAPRMRRTTATPATPPTTPL